MLFAASAFIAFAFVSASLLLFQRRKSQGIQLPSAGLPPRPAPWQARWNLYIQAAIACIFAVEILVGPWELTELGFSQTVAFPLAAIAGGGLYLALASASSLAARALGFQARLQDHNFLVLRSLWPRRWREKRLAFVAVCVLNPFTEELVYRGVLVYALGQHLGGFAIPIVLGLVLTLATHLYQGLASFPGHLLSFSAVILLLFSPLGLAGAIGFHALQNLFPVLGFRRLMLGWRMRHRRPFESRRPAA